METKKATEAKVANPSPAQEEEVANAADSNGDSSPAPKILSETSAEQDSSEEEIGSSGKPTIQLLTGMKEDLAARIPLYRDDWKRPKNLFTVLNAIFFAFVVQLIPALIFAELLDKQTEGSLAVAEVLLSAGIIGVIYALLSGQPLVLLGITGPVAILLGKSYGLAEQYDANYFTFFWWLCIWTSILHLLTAALGLVETVWLITPFATQIFEFFIAMSFVFESIRDLVHDIHLGQAQSEERSAAYASLVIGILTFYICWTLHFAETWVSFSRQLRTFLTSYNMAIAVVIMTALSFLPGVAQDTDGLHGIKRVEIRRVPWDWKPTTEEGEEERPWVTHPLDGIDVKGIFGALFPAFMLYLLFFIDHNISSILTQAPKYRLKKPPAYHWDFFVLGLTIIPCGILGLPPGSGLIPQAPLHTRALCTRKHEVIDGVRREVVTHCEEQRWSALFQALLMFVALSLIVFISWIPVGCLFGVFLYLGVGAMHGNEIWERINLMFMYAKKRPPIPVVAKTSSWSVVRYYTAIQVGLASITFGIAQFATWGRIDGKSTVIRCHVSNLAFLFVMFGSGYVFPALIAIFVPFRLYVVSRFFSKQDLKYLDPVGESDEDYVAEQRELYKVDRDVDEAEVFHGFSELRMKDVDHNAIDYYEHHPDVEPPEEFAETVLRNRQRSSTSQKADELPVVEENPKTHGA
eukprot:CAMPEP_0113654712 /NCGR_PEP_ID=MMETSP0017_2-20120614/29301_1 /TAXON_ID=2856 /ORGANISM="Cylindrotheca closterium" /LENGTH=690 /DNA_ID=CAMNT_0000567875 /DNA_START=66 /DNA_END=2138 /DNA_ORIENTATION=- /assembly_acc=CAM_ASM_000147